MDFQNSYQPELGKLEQIVSQFLLKSLHIVLVSRVPSLHRQDRSGELSFNSRVKKSDKWFNLVLGDRPAALENLNFWHRNVMEPMIIDIILVREGSNASSVDNLFGNSGSGTTVETIIERWIVQYETPRVVANQSGGTLAYKKTYKKSIVLLRALYSYMRLLPAYRIFRQLSTSRQTYNFDIIYKVSSLRDPFSRAEEEMMQEFSFAPVEANPGRLSLSVSYRETLSDFNLEPSTPMPPKIITDYVGSPATDPLRYFPSSVRGDRPASFRLGRTQPSSAGPFQRPHSWTSGFHRPPHVGQYQPVVGSPPTFRASPMSHDVGSPPIDPFTNRVPNYRLPSHSRTPSYDEFQLSPPFSASSSSSPSPSPPTYLSSGSFTPMKTRIRPETAPVSIPNPMGVRGSRYLSPNFSDPNRNSLPPLSPRSTRIEPSSQESPSGIRAYRKLDVSRTGDNMHLGLQKVKDSKDDSGRFSALLSSSGSPRVGFSRSSSKLSFQDDIDDCEFSCPFDVDDVDTTDFHASQNLDGKRASDFTSQSLPIGKKSPGAAVGVLVHMLRTAPPLRQDASCYSSHSVKPEHEEGGGVSTASGFFMPRKTSDALEELRSYREMKDLLISKSGMRVLTKEVED